MKTIFSLICEFNRIIWHSMKELEKKKKKFKERKNYQ